MRHIRTINSSLGKLSLTAAVGSALLLAGCQNSTLGTVEIAPPKTPAPPKVATYADFTIVKQPEASSKPGRGGWPQFVLGIPNQYLPGATPDSPSNGKPATPKPIGTARILDDAGHTANLGEIDPPAKGQTESQLYLTRGFSWHWSHPRLEISVEGQSPKSLSLRDLPDPEVVALPAPSKVPLTCEIIPNLADYGIYGGGTPKPGQSEPGLLLSGKTGIGPETDNGESYQMFLMDTQSAGGLGYSFKDVDPAVGLSAPAKFVPFRFAAATKMIRLSVRRTNNVVETQEISFPGCRLVSKFNGTGFQVDKDITVKGTNGWSYTLPAQYFGPFREPKRDTRNIEIRLDVKSPKTADPESAESTGAGDRAGRMMNRLRGQDVDRQNGLVKTELMSPMPADVGLYNIWVRGKSYSGPKVSNPVKYGEFTLRVRITTTTIKETGTESLTLPVVATSRKPVAGGVSAKPGV